MNRPCFCCGKTLKPDYEIDNEDIERQNWLSATDWITVGNWCSSVFDGLVDPNYKKCSIVICDECFKENKDRIIPIKYTEEEKIKRKQEDDEAFNKIKDILEEDNE